MERFLELYREVYKDLYRLAYYYLGNVHDAEDAVSDAVLAAYVNFGKLKSEEAFRPWIVKILVNRCRKLYRKEGRVQPAGHASDLERLENAGGSTVNSHRRAGESVFAELELLEHLRVLDEEERLIVLLAVFGGYKEKEIARFLKRNYSTIRSRYRRALQKLGKEMQG